MAKAESNPGTPTANNDAITDRDEDYEDATSDFNYWSDEIKNSRTMLKAWHAKGDKVVARYLDNRTGEGTATATNEKKSTSAFRLNIFHSNVLTMRSMLYGNVPKIDVSRRHSDPNDDVARVAGVILERMLNNDVDDNAEEYDSVLRATLEDRLIPGLGVARVRYNVKTRTEPVPPVLDPYTQAEIQPASEKEVVESESAPLDYFHWRDVLWSWARTFSDVRWIGFRNYLTKRESTDRFGAALANQLTYKQQKMDSDSEEGGSQNDPDDNDSWMKAEIWEIWDKTKRQVVWLHLDLKDQLLETKDDPLKLHNFYPTPPFFMANATTSLYKPTPDFHMAQDLYNEVDRLQSRISVITDAVKVVGVYDQSNKELATLLNTSTDNKMIPVEKWAMLAEKGGIAGQVDWFPLEAVVNALINLRQLRDETIALLYQVSGMSDIMRGSLDNQYEGVGQSELKTSFGSIRVQSTQQQYANFATGLMAIKAEIIARHFDPDTIFDQANMHTSTESKEHIKAAIDLIKTPDRARLRVNIKAESIALADYNKIKTERTEYMTALSQFMQASAPLMKEAPGAAPFLLELLQWGLSGFSAGDEIEGVIDKAIAALKDPEQQQQKPDPEAAKAQAQQALEDMKHKNAMEAQQAKHDQALELRQADMFADVKTAHSAHSFKIAETEAELEAEIAGIEAKATADIAVEQNQSEINSNQHAEGVEDELNKDIVAHGLKLKEIAAASIAKIRESRASAEVSNIPTPGAGKDED